MLKELEDSLVLVGQQSEEFQRQVLVAVVALLDEHEDWVSNGSPDENRWILTKYARDPRYAHRGLQNTVKKLLNDTEE